MAGIRIFAFHVRALPSSFFGKRSGHRREMPQISEILGNNSKSRIKKEHGCALFWCG